MHDQIARDRHEFLQRIADRLPFEQAEKIDILRELAVHLSDSTARLEADGLSPDAAEQAAVERLGPPERLADSLTEARRSPRRLLAAAGAGTYAALGGAVYGYLFGLLALWAVSIATAVLAAGPLHLFGGSWGGLLGTTRVTLIAFSIGAYVAGRKLTPIAAARAGYHARHVRVVTSLVGGGIVLAWALAGWRGELDWPNVTLLLSVAAWFVAGAWQATTRPFPSRSWQLKVLAFVCLIVPVALAMGMGTTAIESGGNSFQPTGFEKIGRAQPPAIAAAMTASGGPIGKGTVQVDATFADRSVLAGWSDLRVEAWRGIQTAAEYPGDWIVDPATTVPFAIAPAAFEPTDTAGGAALLGGSVRIDTEPNVALAWIAITGIAPDGQRRIVEGLAFTTTAFNGTVADWLTAVVSGR